MKPAHLCRHLRTKKMYIPALADEAFAGESPELGLSAHCWCDRTLTETGPDDQCVGPDRCSGKRSCFEE